MSLPTQRRVLIYAHYDFGDDDQAASERTYQKVVEQLRDHLPAEAVVSPVLLTWNAEQGRFA